MESIDKKLIIKSVIDVCLLILVILPIMIFHLVNRPFERRFFINDYSIRLPYKPSTVPAAVLVPCGIIITILLIYVIEFFNAKKSEFPLVRSLYKYLMPYFFGCAASHFVADICKYVIGRLSPHFLQICNPNMNFVVCPDPNYYVNNICEPVNANKLKDARRSFISCHSVFATFTMFYLLFFLQYRFCFEKYRLLRHVIQVLLFGSTLYVVQSRYTDNHHHLTDVFAGCVVGLAFAAFCIFWIANILVLELPCRFGDELRLRFLRRHTGHPHVDEETPHAGYVVSKYTDAEAQEEYEHWMHVDADPQTEYVSYEDENLEPEVEYVGGESFSATSQVYYVPFREDASAVTQTDLPCGDISAVSQAEYIPCDDTSVISQAEYIPCGETPAISKEVYLPSEESRVSPKMDCVIIAETSSASYKNNIPCKVISATPKREYVPSETTSAATYEVNISNPSMDTSLSLQVDCVPIGGMSSTTQVPNEATSESSLAVNIPIGDNSAISQTEYIPCGETPAVSQDIYLPRGETSVSPQVDCTLIAETSSASHENYAPCKVISVTPKREYVPSGATSAAPHEVNIPSPTSMNTTLSHQVVCVPIAGMSSSQVSTEVASEVPFVVHIPIGDTSVSPQEDLVPVVGTSSPPQWENVSNDISSAAPHADYITNGDTFVKPQVEY